MNNHRTKRLPKILLGQSLVGLLIFAIAGYLITYSLGYKINLSTRKIIKTGLIVLSIDPKPDSITVSGKEIDPRGDVSIPLEPGYYDVTVQKTGYQDWIAHCEVKAELVNYFKYVELFKTPSALDPLTDRDAIDTLNAPTAVLAVNQPKGLTNNDYEIWLKDKLVTRFSEKISQVGWYPDNHHILFRQGQDIHIVDEDGTNNQIIARLPKSAEVKFMVSSQNQAIYIYQDGEYFSAKIQ